MRPSLEWCAVLLSTVVFSEWLRNMPLGIRWSVNSLVRPWNCVGMVCTDGCSPLDRETNELGQILDKILQAQSRTHPISPLVVW